MALSGTPPILNIPQNPTQDLIQDLIQNCKSYDYDTVLAIGGGSVLDTSKILANLPQQKNSDLSDYIDHSFEFSIPSKTLIAIPTTSGTGSEVTPYASLETREQKKVTISHPHFYPAVAVLDPELTYSMPAYVSACTGFDALSQAIESYWSIASTPFSETHALRGLELIGQNLNRVIQDPLDTEARANMTLGSCEAGLAIAQTKTTAVHAVSYPMTAHFKVAHGHACALTLSSFVRFNAPVMEKKSSSLLKTFGVSNFDEMAQQLDSLMEKVGLERKLSKLHIHQQGIEIILRDGFRPDRIKNNPRLVTREDLAKILKSIQ